MSLFQPHLERLAQLDSLSGKLIWTSSLLELHAWYQSKGGVLEPNLATAAAYARDAALILQGKEAKDGKASPG